MPAGRPRKYRTDEERAEAHRRASSKHYYGNRAEIGARRKIQREGRYAKDKQCLSPSSNEEMPPHKHKTVRNNRVDEGPSDAGQPKLCFETVPVEAAHTLRPSVIEPPAPQVQMHKNPCMVLDDLESALAEIRPPRKPLQGLLTDLCTNFVSKMKEFDTVKALDVFLEPINELSEIEERVESYLRGSDVGASEERARILLAEAKQLHAVLDDLVTEAIMGPNAFVDDFVQRKHSFQRG